MSVTLLPVIPRRSSSLPISTETVHDRPCCPSRHGSIPSWSSTQTPSPRQVLIRPELTVDDSQPPPYSDNDSDHSPCISPPRSPPHSLSESAPDQDMDMDRDDVLPLPPPIPAKPPTPAKLLDDEEEHLHRSLRLQDFELRGTLGAYCLNWSTLSYILLRNGYIRARPPCQVPSCIHLHQPIRRGFSQ